MPGANNMRDKKSGGSKHKFISKKTKKREKADEEAKQKAKDDSGGASKQPRAPPLGEGNLRVLLLGEGDFSFAAALAYTWAASAGDCDSVTATTLGTEASTLALKGAEDSTEAFKAFGGTVMYGVDATALHTCDRLYPRMGKEGFQRIVFNFPALEEEEHTQEHRAAGRVVPASVPQLIAGWFASVLKGKMLAKNGQLQLTLPPSRAAEWDVKGLANAAGLRILSVRPFDDSELHTHGYAGARSVEVLAEEGALATTYTLVSK